jgi:HEAT repeat protein
VRALADCLKRDGDESVRKAALTALVNLAGPEDKTVASELRGLLGHPELEVSRGAAFALGNIGGPEAAVALPVLRTALRDEDPGVKAQAAAALANLGEHAAPAMPELSVALSDSDPSVRRNSALAFSRIGQQAAPAVETLANVLPQEPNADVRRFAAEALARVGSAVDKVIPQLLRTLQEDKDHHVRQRTVWALFQVRDLEATGVVGPLTNVLNETDRESLMVRYDAARCLALRLGPRSPDRAVDVLLEMLNDKNIRIYNRTDAKVSGGVEGQGGDTRVNPNLGGDARFLAAQALARIGKPKADRPAIIEALKDAAQSPDQRCRDESTKALAAIQGP